MNWTLADGTVFAGNDDAKAHIAARLNTGSLPHALLLEGPIGSGRRTMARLIAAAAVCRGGDERPCGHCAACQKSLRAIHPDITELGGTEEARSFHIDAYAPCVKRRTFCPTKRLCACSFFATCKR